MERRTRLLLLAGVKPLTADHRLLLPGRRYGGCPTAWLCVVCPHVPWRTRTRDMGERCTAAEGATENP
jgi:hypothetical protein